MKSISQTQFQRIPSQDWSITLRSINQAVRLSRLAREIAGEVCDTIAGVFEMPLRQPMHDKQLERLDEHLLRDIGRK